MQTYILRINIFLLIMCGVLLPGFAQVFDIVVDKNGSGNYLTIQEAINAVGDNLTTRTKIFVKQGEYSEKVQLPSTKKNVSLIGENCDKVILTWDDYQGKDGLSGANSYTFLAEGDDLYMENISVVNSAGPVGQAVAIRTTGERQIFKNCRFLGNQDTYYAHKNRQYNFKCWVEGTTDFIYGDATAVFDECNINCVKGGSYISAPADTKLTTQLTTGKFLHGLLFRNCAVIANEDVSNNSFYLGRPWQPNASSVFIRCTLGSHIKPEGWSIWSGTNNHETSYFAEYKNINPDGSLVDVSNRVDWSYQVSDTYADVLYRLNFFLKKNGIAWDPTLMTSELAAPTGLSVINNQLNWNAVEGALGYVVYRNDSVVGFSASNQFTDNAVNPQIQDYKVLTVNTNGNLSLGLGYITSINPMEITNSNQLIQSYANGVLLFAEPVEFKIFTISGIVLMEGKNTSILNLIDLNQGIYIVKVKNSSGKTEIRKVVN